MFASQEEDPRGQAPPVDERGTLTHFLAFYRRTFEMKCQGLSDEQLARRSVPPSNMSLLGLVRHLADVERHWFREVLSGEQIARRYRTADDRDADFNGAIADPTVVDDARAAWREEVAFADQCLERFDDLGSVAAAPRGSQTSLRGVLVHMIEEYARHCGHADLLRERIDGRVGQ